MTVSREPWHRSARWPAFVLLLGLAVSLWASMWQIEQVERQARLDFQRSVDRLADDISKRLNQPVNGLRGAAAAYAARGGMDLSGLSLP